MGNLLTPPKFGDIFFAELPDNGHVQSGIRPVLIVQNDTGNKYSPTIEVLPLTSRVTKASYMPTHVYVEPNSNTGLSRASIIMAENAMTIPQIKLINYLGYLDEMMMIKVAAARAIQSPLPYSLL